MFAKQPLTEHVGYTAEAAFLYEEKRFSTKQGQLFDFLEMRQVDRAIKGLNPESRILEVGCGTARFSRRLSEKKFDIVATDVSQDMLDVASEKCKYIKNISFKLSEGGSLQLANCSFDFVFAIRVLNQTGSRDYALKTIKEMVRVAKAGGLVLIEFPSKDRPLYKIKDQIRFSFHEIEQFAKIENLEILWGNGVLFFSQSVLDRMPTFALPLWKWCEQIACHFLWRYASRVYILMRKAT
jgi:ubiquinone/menaquinone biosynthesis C-methylase UbiE